MSAPCSNGRHKNGDAIVLSTSRGRAVLVGDFGPCAQVGHDGRGVGDRLAEQELGAFIDRRPHRVERRGVDEVARPAKPLEGVAELGDRAAVQRVGCDEVVAGLEQGKEGEQLGGMARSASDAGSAALEGGDPFLEGADRRIAEPTVDEPEVLQIEQRCRVVGVVKHEGRRLVDRYVASARVRVGQAAGVNRSRRKAILSAHR